LSSCLLEDGLFSPVEVKDFAVLPETLHPGSAAKIIGTVISDTPLVAPEFAVFDENGHTQLVNIGSVNALSVSGKQLDFEKAGALFTITTAACSGHYLLRLIARDLSGERRTLMAPFAITQAACTYGTPDTAGNLHGDFTVVKITKTLGNVRNAQAGSIDLDDFSTYTHAAAKVISSRIDLYFGQDPTDKSDRIFTPAEAKLRGIGASNSGPATWPAARATPMKQIHLAQGQFDGITTQAEIDALWAAGGELSSALAVAGNVFAAKTDAGKVIVFRLRSYVPGEAGSLTLESFR